MKNDAIDLFKGIVLLIITSVLVMAYTTIERTVITSSENVERNVLPGFTPVSIGLLDKSKEVKRIPKKTRTNEYVLVRYKWPISGLQLDDKNIAHTRFTLILL